VTLHDRVRFYQQLAVLARSGVPLRASLERLRERFSGKEMALLGQQVNAGARVEDAFVAAGFSPFECHLVGAGERSGRLETVFEHLSEFWLRQREMRHALLRPLYYPVVMLHLVIVVGSLVELAYASWPVVAFHLFGRLLLLYAVGIFLYVVARGTWRTEIGQRFWLFLPLVGGSLSAAYAYRWITALKLEYSAGIPMPDAVADAWRASGYVGSERLAVEGEAALREGAELSGLVQRWRWLPRDWIDFIETGEVSGALEKALENLDAEASRAWSRAEQRMSEWLPKIVYFVILLIVAWQVATLMYKVEIEPMSDAEKAIDQANP
jgi:type IV pilus assembly protein PilC